MVNLGLTRSLLSSLESSSILIGVLALLVEAFVVFLAAGFDSGSEPSETAVLLRFAGETFRGEARATGAFFGGALGFALTGTNVSDSSLSSPAACRFFFCAALMAALVFGLPPLAARASASRSSYGERYPTELLTSHSAKKLSRSLFQIV